MSSSRRIKPVFYIYVDTNSRNNNTENFYFSLLSRHFHNIVIETGISLEELKRVSNRRKRNKNDRFIAIVDGDIDYNNPEQSLNARVQSIYNIVKNKNIEVFITNRCWENWIILHYEYFSKFTLNNTPIPIPNYEKNKKWYMENEESLIKSINLAIEHGKKLRVEKFRDENISFLSSEENPKLRTKDEIERILSINPITFIDCLLQDMIRLEG